MPIAWRTRKGLQPDVILKKLDRSKIVEGDKVSFGGFDKIESEIAISSMLKFDTKISSIEKSGLISKAIWQCAKSELSPKMFLATLNRELQILEAAPEQEFLLLTSISIRPPFIFPSIVVAGCTIRFLPKNFSNKFTKARSEALGKTSQDELGYCNVIIETKDRSAHDAGEACLNAINVLRSFMCLIFNSQQSYTFGSGKPKPINKVVLGQNHTLHLKSGALATKTYWYEPTYTGAKPYVIERQHRNVGRKNIRWFLRSLDVVPFRSELQRVLARFVNAFDHIDHHSTLTIGWGCLESLASDGNVGNADLVTRRCSFLFSEDTFHRQILEHVREYRNNNIHHGESSDDATVICYQLQRYFRELILFYLRRSKEFPTKIDANSFLDMPPDVEALKARVQLFKRAIKFRDPPNKKFK